ncbi:NitT/TauT family transport system substrate-binding protein [Rhodovulum imhoffii]|uniref:NitT/TauT family transport system substrate-binding protein n=1 Tax=Rhodovulum imhoffii TaxID=365340 RepID=A0A2T5BTM5_9RHOB|nr:ABC transporter substrate-binding protein [Rhodovulum imhoffii]MBK5934141.1 ABC transporter substrate-binding protein [Rhodovulum imhoffii]PTN02785.1 NitT/TauT family transport system substrate-binding protein [Rhodovulum imhoffii]
MPNKIMLAAALVFGATAVTAETVRIGLQPWLGYGPLWVAEEKGYFDKHGVDVALSSFNWDQDMTAALASGNLDMIATATNAVIAAYNQGVDQKGVLVMDVAHEADAILAGENVNSLEDLRGKTVAFETGATSDLLMNYALKASGMSLADVEHIPMGASEAGLALLSGRVDAAVTYEPYVSAALGRDAGYKVVYTAAEKPGLISDLLTARGDWIAENPDAVEAVIRAWNDAVVFIHENPEDGGAMIARAVGSPMEEFQPAFEGVRLYDLADNIALVDGEFPATLREIAEIMKATNPGEISIIPAATDIMALEPMHNAAN